MKAEPTASRMPATSSGDMPPFKPILMSLMPNHAEIPYKTPCR
jgi:hypothetical protein